MLNPDVLVAVNRAVEEGVTITECRGVIIRVRHERDNVQEVEHLERVLALNGFVPSDATERDRFGTYFIKDWTLRSPVTVHRTTIP